MMSSNRVVCELEALRKNRSFLETGRWESSEYRLRGMDPGKRFLGSPGEEETPGCDMGIEVVHLGVWGGRTVGPWFGCGK